MLSSRAAWILLVGLAPAAWAQSAREGGVTLFRGQRLAYEVVEGLAVHDGDIVLGTAEEAARLAQEPPARKPILGGPIRRDALAPPPQFLWPGGVIPYVIDPDLPEAQNIAPAIEHWNANTVITLVPRTDEADFVRFRASEGPCAANLGRKGGEQSVFIQSEGCDMYALVHEIGHAVGLWHEHNRWDRDRHLMLLDPGFALLREYERHTPESTIAAGPYDYASTMHYSLTTWETIPPGLTGPAGGLSAGDIDGVARLYGRPPTQTTISTNPSGLQVLVDGRPFTAPARFAWPAGSEHAIEVPSPQRLGPGRFVFGRWNDQAELPRQRSVTADPAATWFESNFIAQYRVGTSVDFQGDGPAPGPPGTVALEPGSPDGWYTVRAPVRATAIPADGLRFWGWSMWAWPLRGTSSNPAAGRVTAPPLEYRSTFDAVFTDLPVFRIESSLDAATMYLDGELQIAPLGLLHLASDPWAEIAPKELEQRDIVGTRWRFAGWNDGGSRERRVNVGPEGGSIRAQWNREVELTTAISGRSDPGASGRILVEPSSADGFYPEGTRVRLTAEPAPGSHFARWSDPALGARTTAWTELDRPSRVEAVFVRAEALRPRTAQQVDLPAAPGPPFRVFEDDVFAYRVAPPVDATRVTIAFEPETQDIRATLIAKADEDWLSWNLAPDNRTPAFEADFQSRTANGLATIVIDAGSAPPLDPDAIYSVWLVTHTPEVPTRGTLAVAIETPSSPRPAGSATPRALTFVAPFGAEAPAAQTVRLRNEGGGLLQFRIESDRPWLAAAPAEGSIYEGDGRDVEVAVIPAGVPAGTHRARLTVSFGDGGTDQALGNLVAPVTFAVVQER